MGFLDFLNGNKSKTITFATLPKNIEELKAMPQAALTDEFEAAALVVAALCRYEESVDDALEMINYLKGPSPVSTMDVQFLRDRLVGKTYKPRSYVETLATLYIKSGGADSPRPISMRKKPSTGQWFVTQFGFLADIRVPVSEDPWA